MTERYNSSSETSQRQRAGDGSHTAPSSGTVNVETEERGEATARWATVDVWDGPERRRQQSNNTRDGDCRRLGRTRPTTTTITAEPRRWSSLDADRSLRTPVEPNVVSDSNRQNVISGSSRQPIRCTNSDHLYAYMLIGYSKRLTNVTTLENQHKPKKQNIGKR